MGDMEPHHTKGHRARVRDRFLKAGVDGLSDYELLEMILMAAIPRRDVKPLAKDMLKDFGSYPAILSARMDRLLEYPGLGKSAVALIKVVEASVATMTRAKIDGVSIVTSWNALIDYLKSVMAHLSHEQFRVLYLGSNGKIISDAILSEGDGMSVQISARDIVAKALSLDASGIVLAHNHPSGSAKPSQSDIETTRSIASVCDPLGIKLHDHIILTKSEIVSFKDLGLL